MEYSITHSEDKLIVFLKVTGNINRQYAIECNIAAHEYGKKLGINRYLMDLVNSRNVDTTMGNYKFAYQDMQSAPVDRDACVAILVHPDDHSHDFIETLAKNTGLNVNLFRDRDEALSFLYDCDY